MANVELFSESEGSGSGSEWRLRKEAKQQAWCRGGAVLGVVGRVPCASVDRRSLLV